MRTLPLSLNTSRNYVLERGTPRALNCAGLVAFREGIVDWFSVFFINDIAYVSVMREDGTLALVTRELYEPSGFWAIEPKVEASDEDDFHRAVFNYIDAALSRGDVVTTADGHSVSRDSGVLQVG